MYCSNCGQLLKDGVNFCSNCGKKIIWPAEPEAEPVSVQEETSASAVEETAAEVPAGIPEPEEEKPAEDVTVAEEVPAEESAEPVQPEEISTDAEASAEETAEPKAPAAEEPVKEEPAAEPEALPADETPAPEETAEEKPEPAVKPKKKKNKTVLYAAIAAAVIIAGILIYNMLPGTRYNRAVKAAEQYMTEVNYAAAAEEYEKALTIRPEDEAVSADAAAAFAMVGAELLGNEKYEEAIALVDRTMPLVRETDRDVVRMIAEDAYTYKSDDMVAEGDFSGAKAWLQEGIDKGYELQTTLANVEKEEKYLDAAAAQQKFLTDIAERLDSEDYEGALDLFRDEYAKLVADESTYGYRGPLFADISGGKYKRAGLYKDDVYFAVYYGDYSGEDREGNGIYLIYNPGGLFSLNTRYYVTGEWKGDMPNGTVTEHRKIYEGSELQQEAVIKASVTDGIYNGDVEWTQDGETYYGSYTDGIINVIDTTDPNGEANKVAMYNSDRTKWRYFISESSYSRVFGMIGFGMQ